MMRSRLPEAILNVTILPTTKCNNERPLVWAVAAALGFAEGAGLELGDGTATQKEN